jgi:hypothetical protein
MVYRIAWMHRQNTLFVALDEVLSTSDIACMVAEIVSDYLAGCLSPVTLVLDMARLERFPLNILQMRTAMTPLLDHPMLAEIVVIGRSQPLALCVLETLARTYGVPCKTAPRADWLPHMDAPSVGHLPV